MVARSARTRFLVSGMLDFMDCFEALIGKNLERTKKSCQHENCSSLSLVCDCKVSQIMDKYRLGFMLGKISSVNGIKPKISAKSHCCMAFAFRPR